MRPTFRISARFSVGMALGLFVLSLFLSTLIFDEHEPVKGFELLAWGWWGVLQLNYAWFANLFFFKACVTVFKGNYTKRLISPIIAFVLAINSFLADKYWFDESHGTPIRALGAGFYVWLTAIAIVLVASIVHRTKKAEVLQAVGHGA